MWSQATRLASDRGVFNNLLNNLLNNPIGPNNQNQQVQPPPPPPYLYHGWLMEN